MDRCDTNKQNCIFFWPHCYSDLFKHSCYIRHVVCNVYIMLLFPFRNVLSLRLRDVCVCACMYVHVQHVYKSETALEIRQKQIFF